LNSLLFVYRGDVYPTYLRDGNACQFFEPFARHFCKGEGLDVGCGQWPLPWAIPIDIKAGTDAMSLPPGPFDFIASSHCLEHLDDPVSALEHWHARLRPGGVLALYLPHHDQIYWRPEFCKKHRHSWTPERMAEMVSALGFVDVLHSERDMAWSFCVVGFKP
jgi:SAM-dependent methyltransferase